jgi:hypothetical protein
VRAATSVGPAVSVEQYRSTCFFHVAALATTPQLATELADSAAQRMLACFTTNPGNESYLAERAKRPLNPYQPNFRIAVLAVVVGSTMMGLAGIALLLTSHFHRRNGRLA